jgi:hypothetical protein
MNLKAIKDRITALLTDKSSGIQPEFRQQLSEISKRIEDLLRDNRGECDIPDDLIKEIARCLVPDIIAFFETEEAKREFEEWKAEQDQKNDNKTKRHLLRVRIKIVGESASRRL